MKDKKAAKKLIKLAKEHPEWYSEEDVRYAKQVKWRIKQEKLEQKINDCIHLFRCKNEIEARGISNTS